MDLNRKYSDHQKAILMASATPDRVLRELHLDRASLIAEEIECFQLKLGAAASCAWSALTMEAATRPGAASTGREA